MFVWRKFAAAHAGFVKGGHIESTALSPQFVCLFLTVGIASLLYQEHVPGLSIVLAGYGSVLLHSGADAYIVVSVGSFVTGVVFTLLGIRYRRYKTLHRPFSPDAADKASSQSLSDDQ